MGNVSFGQFAKKLRIDLGQTLREFCRKNSFDSANHSRLERGVTPAPGDAYLEKYAIALGLSPGSDDWTTFYDLAALSRGEVPADIMGDERLLSRLPVFFRVLRRGQEELDSMIDIIRKS